MIPAQVDRFRLSVGRLTTLLSYWTPPRFSAAASPLVGDAVSALCATSGSALEEGVSVAERLHVVVQVLADLGADAEGQPRRAVPRMVEPGTLVDQLTVLGDDYVAADPDVEELDRVTRGLDALRAAL
ncbi:hypothetical protein CryarDRAFT_1024 [Cryptosporangium arvum DSM 44712]|uniref:Uncharacterized protein n=1 Tax=Cryptosporangium arvum DSM 44712 TaxID=927661 RepID=A0A010ZMR1_9ACTN|nr:hypothetical protein CryarDRAFT_1024 [Cryptosporangium arvum DSM 44712]